MLYSCYSLSIGRIYRFSVEAAAMKIARDETNRTKLDKIEEVQNYLSERVDGILPFERVDDLLVISRAPRTRADEISD